MSTVAGGRLLLAGFVSLASATFLAGTSLSSQGAPAGGLATREVRLAMLPPEADLKGWRVGGSRVAFVLKLPKGQAVVMDGVTGPVWDEVVRDSEGFTADGRHFSYVAKRGDKWFAVIDGNASKPWDEIAGKQVAWSADGSRGGYCARSGKTWRTVVDGVESAASDERLMRLTFSHDGKRMAVVAGTPATFGWQPRMRVILDGVEGSKYVGIAGVWFSQDGHHAVICAKVKDFRSRVVIDGVEGPEFGSTSLEYPVWASPFSPGGGKTAYVGERDGKSVLVVDGKVVREVDGGFGPVVASRDGQHLAYWYALRQKWWQLTKDPRGDVRLVTDGAESAIYRGAKNAPVFSADGTRLAYAAAMENGDAAVVVDGEERATYKAFAAGSLRFSPDGRHLAYLARRQDWFLVLDGKEGPATYPDVRQPLVFTGDSAHVVFFVADGGGYRVVADGGRTSDRYDYLTPGLTMTGPHSFAVVALRGRELLRLEVDAAPAP